jgi:hypothetical protein
MTAGSPHGRRWRARSGREPVVTTASAALAIAIGRDENTSVVAAIVAFVAALASIVAYRRLQKTRHVERWDAVTVVLAAVTIQEAFDRAEAWRAVHAA